jgi:hypothetical protein
MIMEKQIKLAAKLYETRDAVKSMLGPKYAEKMDELGGCIEMIANKKKCSDAAAAALLAEASADGMATILIMAALAERLEPSNAKAVRRAASETSAELDKNIKE